MPNLEVAATVKRNTFGRTLKTRNYSREESERALVINYEGNELANQLTACFSSP